MADRLVSVDDNFDFPDAVVQRRAAHLRNPRSTEGEAVGVVAKIAANTVGQIQAPLPYRGPLGILRAALALMKTDNPAIGGTVNIGFMGSSTTAGHTTAVGNRWVSLLAAKITNNAVLTDLEAYYQRNNMPKGINIINAAVNGATTANYFQDGRGDRLALVKPRLIVHTVGANDFYNNYTVEQFKTNIVAAIDYMNIKVGAPVAHLLIHSYERYDMNPASPAGRAQWNDFRDVMVAVAQERPATVAFLDISETFRSVGIPNSDPFGLMMTDKVHMNDYGHRLYADVIGAALGLTGSSATTPPVTPAAPPIVMDGFDRADGALGTTPTGAKAWSALQGEVRILDGQAVATSLNAAAGTPTGAGVVVDAGLADCIVTAQFGVVGSQGPFFRTQPNGAGYYFMWSVAGGEYRIGKRNADGGFTKLVGTGTAYTYSPTARLSVEMRGASIIGKLDGQKVLEVTDTSFSSTKHGLLFADSVGHIDSFRVDPIPAA